MTPGIRFGVLGSVLASDNGIPVTIAATRQRTLLTVLLLHANQAVSFDRLADAVWDGAPPSGARTTLRSYVMRLRQTLGGALGARLVSRAPGYAVEVADDELDLLAFGRLHRSGSRAAENGEWEPAARILAEALAAWRGAPLLDVESQTLHRDEGQRLSELRVHALRLRIDADLRLGAHDRLIAELRQLIAEYPLQEHLHGQLMQALYGAGRQAEALAAYHEARRRLAEDLGLEPGPDLQRLHRRGDLPAGEIVVVVSGGNAEPPVPVGEARDSAAGVASVRAR